MKRLFLIGATATAALLLFPSTAPVGMSVAQAASETEFICPDSGAGLSAVDVLQATGEHDVFLDCLIEPSRAIHVLDVDLEPTNAHAGLQPRS